MASFNYFTAAYPEPWQILGVNLKPFSVGHFIKLKRLGCAFVAEDSTPATIGDLLLGIIVCSMSSDPDPEQDEFWRWYHRESPHGIYGGLMWRLKKVAARILGKQMLTPAEYDVYQFGRRVGQFDLEEKCKLFQRYVADNTIALPHWIEPPKGDEKKSGAHWVHSMVSCLSSHCGYSAKEAYNTTFAKALADYLKHAESNGIVRLMTEEEMKLTEAATA